MFHLIVNRQTQIPHAGAGLGSWAGEEQRAEQLSQGVLVITQARCTLKVLKEGSVDLTEGNLGLSQKRTLFLN